ncbi:DUF3592 domain-containing protein [Novosphingobium sp. KCTC 2891]|uniref:DUF3592 domain-containing protein n=1 Tax=Novosphingobium sp. KCTC 2891 TaxID=2989730 RepID=UPI00222130D2|nr:DUF3592 domain-containing protein [Novosphingobium sp. KCTC 2891]MCW1383283.1 DUF3592 domain-containing protein [Novosphingobium sp. KCTC 2891]
MERSILLAGLALCLFSLWALLRHDVRRLIAPAREARAVVVGHVANWDDGERTYAARLRFQADEQVHEVTDQRLRRQPLPPEGAAVIVRFPAGRPDLARIPHPWMWAWVYAAVTMMAVMLLARLLGWAGS